MKSPILLSLLLLSSSSATKGAFTAAFISPFCNAPPPSSQRLSAHKCKEQQHQGTSSFDLETTRRAALQILSSVPILTSAAAASPASALELKSAVLPIPPQARETSWPLGKVAFSLLPLAGSYSRRATVKETFVDNGADGIWTFDQLQGVVNVNVPVRMTVVKLSQAAGGGLWIHNPLAPTPQLISEIRQLERLHGPVRHIVLGTVALEHKATLGPFAQYFSNATVWIQPGQWSFPIQLPVEFLGVPQTNDKLRILPSSSFIHGDMSLQDEVQSIAEPRYKYWARKQPTPEWTADIDYETLGPLKFQSVGAYSETAFYHKSTKTLVVTDCICSVTSTPPKIIQEDPRALLYHARDSIEDIVVDDRKTREKGWRRMVQFGLVFFPSQIEVVPLGRAIREAGTIDNRMKTLGAGGVPGNLYPWTWHDNDVDLVNFNAVSRDGKLFCPPILTKLILDREPQQTLDWVDRITKRFGFTHVIPGHLNNYVEASPKEFSAAFDPLRSNPKSGRKVFPQRALPEDLALLQEASDLLTKFGVVAESKVCDLEPARRVGRFAALAPK